MATTVFKIDGKPFRKNLAEIVHDHLEKTKFGEMFKTDTVCAGVGRKHSAVFNSRKNYPALLAGNWVYDALEKRTLWGSRKTIAEYRRLNESRCRSEPTQKAR